jgi:sulfotransferase family protein
MTRANYAVARTLELTHNAEALAARLDPMLARYPDMALLCDENPIEVQRLRDLRQSNIDKGLPSVVLITQPKSGSVSVGGIFNIGFNLPSFAYSLFNLEVMESWTRDYVRGGVCWVTHLLPKSNNIARLKRGGVSKIIVHVRDPRQALLSWMHHISRYSAEFPESANRRLAARSGAELVEEFFDDYVSSIRWIEGWMDAEAELTVLYSTFESFVEDQERFVNRYLEFYEGAVEHFSFERAMNRVEGTDYHFRLGQPDEWRAVFPREEAKRLTRWLPERLKERFKWSD